MKIYTTPYQYYSNIKQNVSTKPTFKAITPVETLTHCNIGMMPNGLIGKVRVMNANGKEAFLNVFKNANPLSEIYLLRDDLEQTIGLIELKIKKILDYDKLEYSQDPSHVFVDTLRNFSNPRTPYYTKGLEEYTSIGTRLMQIALKRSNEARCNGNIELIFKNGDSEKFYHRLGLKNMNGFWWNNPNKMYLPPESKESLSKMYGGL